MIQFLPYALAAYGGYKGYRGAKKSGASGLQSILAGAAGAYTGYNLGQVGGFASNAGFGNAASANFVPSFTQTAAGGNIARTLGMQTASTSVPSPQIIDDPNQSKGGSLLDILKTEVKYSPGKVSAAIAAGTYLSGAFNPQPTRS